MRVALISDLHSSVVPLEAVLEDIARANVDRIVCLGDLIDLGPQPREVIATVRDREIPCILGNHDWLEGEVLAPPEVNAWCRAQLEDEDRRYLAGLPRDLSVDLPNGRLLCVHGSPRSFDDQILATTPDAVLDAWLADEREAYVVAAGHTHVQLLRRHHARTIVNAGSVAMPFIDPYDPDRPTAPRLCPWAEYAIIDDRKNEALDVDLRRVTFDFDALAHDLRKSGLPDPEGWIASWSR